MKILPLLSLIFLNLIPIGIVVTTYMIYGSENAHAENFSLGIAQYHHLDEKPLEGDIISIREGKYIRANSEYDSAIVGVVTFKPALSISTSGSSDGKYPIVDSGDVQVNVCTINGPIHKGDMVTTSLVPGVGMRLSHEGFAVGLADEDFVSDNPKEIKKIKIALHPQYVYTSTLTADVTKKQTLLDSFNLSSLKKFDKIAETLKIIFAVVMALASFGLGFITFRRIAARAIEATGRNPLAGRLIIFNLVVNVLVTLVIMAGGLTLSYYILTLS